MMGHVRLHDFCWVLAFEDEALTKGCIETEVVCVREPDKVTRTVIGVVAV